jgi:hypothetical protein
MKSVGATSHKLFNPTVQLTSSQFTSNLATLGALASTVAASNPIVVQGQDFIDSVTNKRFMVLGVDYQEGGQGADFSIGDPLTNATRCLRDAALMQVCILSVRIKRAHS